MEGMTLYDRDIREPLFEFLEQREEKCRIFEEVAIGKSRADAALVTEESITGIEIKSDADTYARLKTQVRDYNRWFDRNLLVIGTRHVLHACSHVPDEWGILTVEYEGNAVDIYEVRHPADNPGVKLEKQLELLWRPELAAILNRYGLPKYTEKSKRFVQMKLLEKLEPEVLASAIRTRLFERDYSLIRDEISAWKKNHGRL